MEIIGTKKSNFPFLGINTLYHHCLLEENYAQHNLQNRIFSRKQKKAKNQLYMIYFSRKYFQHNQISNIDGKKDLYQITLAQTEINIWEKKWDNDYCLKNCSTAIHIRFIWLECNLHTAQKVNLYPAVNLVVMNKRHLWSSSWLRSEPEVGLSRGKIDSFVSWEKLLRFRRRNVGKNHASLTRFPVNRGRHLEGSIKRQNQKKTKERWKNSWLLSFVIILN